MSELLVEFMEARIGEDQECAEAVARQRQDAWRRSDPWSLTASDEYDALHIEVDPARVLAECEAKRRIVARFEFRRSMQAEDRTEPQQWDDLTRHYYEVVRDLASVHADHPDYREEWRP